MNLLVVLYFLDGFVLSMLFFVRYRSRGFSLLASALFLLPVLFCWPLALVLWSFFPVHSGWSD